MDTATEFRDAVYYVHLYLTCMLDYVHNAHSFYSVFPNIWSAKGRVLDEI